jgi:cbb3-type cytochrome oxidase subunit 3
MAARLWDLAMALRPVELLLMGAIFVYVAWRAWSPRQRRHHEEHAMIPLRDDDDPR